ncbi:MAG TPA: hypothetical protein ENL06_00840, partial [Candidatus Portnoybacteria bacterium]|nr:hypothetical protein [Candidatus Portnoybacteria bacterium]
MRKNIWVRFKKFKKGSFWKWSKRVLLVLAFLIVFQVVYFFLTFYTDLWMHYPGIYRFQAAFSRMQMSCYYYPVQSMCREKCGIERESYRLAIIDYLSKLPMDDYCWQQTKEAIFDQENSDCFRIELVDLVYQIQQKQYPKTKDLAPPQLLMDYLNKIQQTGESNDAVAQEILRIYGQSAFSGQLFNRYLKQVQDPQTPCQVKYYALNNLARYGDSETLRPIFQKLIEENKDPEHLWIGYEAARALDSPKHKDRKFVSWCEKIIWGDYNEYVKEEVLKSLSLYIYNNKAEKAEKNYIIEIYKKIYFDKKQNEFLRRLSSDLLVAHLGKETRKLYPKSQIT